MKYTTLNPYSAANHNLGVTDWPSEPSFKREPVKFMSSASSAVTYTSVYTDSEPGRVFWGADVEIPDGGVPRVIVYGYDGLPMQPVDPPSPDYVPGPEQHPSSPLTIPTPGYVPDSDPEEDPKEDSEEHADYPADGGDGDDDPSNDDSDDDTDDDDEEPFEDEKEHLALADSSTIPVVDPVPSAGDTEARIAEYATAPTPPLPVASPPLPLPSPLTTSLTDAGAPLGYRAAGIQMRVAAASPPLLLPSTSHRTDIGESSASGAARRPGPTLEADAWDEIVEAMIEIAPTTLEGVDQRVTELDTTTSSEERSAAIEAHVRTLEAQVATLIAHTTSIQTQLTTLLRRIARLEARDPEPQDRPAEAGSSC
ncbi:hypothetical protein Tco_0287782 [Tanacetum coccineum]